MASPIPRAEDLLRSAIVMEWWGGKFVYLDGFFRCGGLKFNRVVSLMTNKGPHAGQSTGSWQD